MKIILNLLVFQCLYFALHCQKQYLLEYDRINDVEKYYELTYAKGSYTSKPISKPTLRKGDMLRFRGVNVNPNVFSMRVDEPQEIRNTNPVGNAIAGFNDILGKANGVFRDLSYKISNVSTSMDVPMGKSRGATLSQAEMQRINSLAKISEFQLTLNQAYNSVAEYKKASDAAMSISMTKDEILNALRSSLSDEAVRSYRTALSKLEEDHDNLVRDTMLKITDYSQLEEAYQAFEKLDESLLSPRRRNEMIAQIESSDFTQEANMVVGFNGNYKSFNLNNQAGFIDYSMEFLSRESNSGRSSSLYRDDLIQNHVFHLETTYPGGFSWATGGVYCAPFSGFSAFRLQEQTGDSSLVTKDDASKGRLTLGTSLLYNFPGAGAVMPHVLLGTSIAFASDGTYPLNFLLGAGFRLKSFPFVSLASGISFSQNQKLQNGIALNTLYSNESINIDTFTRKVYSPGYFIAINFNLQ
jgi:hypothetical protein